MILGIGVNQLANVFEEQQNRIALCISNDGGNAEKQKIAMKQD